MPSTLNEGWTYRARVERGVDGMALARWLARRFDHTPVEGWQARVEAGEVEVDARPADRDARVRRGQAVVWHRPPWEEPDVPLGVTTVDVDSQLLVVDKPAGLPTLPSGGYLLHTLLTVVRAEHPEATPMHRLGTGTSGLVLFARTLRARRELQEAWREGRVLRGYRGVLRGRPHASRFTVDTPIGPVPHALLGTVHGASPVGREASSTFEVVGARGEDAVVDVRIDTGRPHQIRIHAACAGHPLLGDPLYEVGGTPRADARPTEGGYLLHAAELQAPDPSGRGVRAWRSTPPWEVGS